MRCDNKAAILSKYLTVSEKALLAKGEDGKTNAEVLLSHPDVIAVLSKNYSLEYGFEIKSEELKKAFIAAENAATEKSHFQILRAAFGLKDCQEKKDEKKEETKEAQPETKKEERVDEKKDDKHEEPKHEEPKPEEPKQEEPKNDEPPKEGDA